MREVLWPDDRQPRSRDVPTTPLTLSDLLRTVRWRPLAPAGVCGGCYSFGKGRGEQPRCPPRYGRRYATSANPHFASRSCILVAVLAPAIEVLTVEVFPLIDVDLVARAALAAITSEVADRLLVIS